MAEKSFPVAGQYLIQRAGRPVGLLSVCREEEAACRGALEGGGLDLEAVAVEEEEGYALGEDCTEEQPRACEIATALGMAEAIGTQAGVDVSEVVTLVESSAPISEHQAAAAVRAIVGRLPANFRPAGEELVAVAFGGS